MCGRANIHRQKQHVILKANDWLDNVGDVRVVVATIPVRLAIPGYL